MRLQVESAGAGCAPGMRKAGAGVAPRKPADPRSWNQWLEEAGAECASGVREWGQNTPQG